MTQRLPNPLMTLHRQAEAETQPYGDALEIISTFGQPEAEYAAIRKGCALLDLPNRGIIELRGADRLPFLNNLLTNQLWDKQAKRGIEAGQGVYAFLLDARSGRIIADMNVLERGDATWLETDARMVESIVAALEKYRFAEKVEIASRLGQWHEIALHGPGAKTILGEGEAPAEPGAAADRGSAGASPSHRSFAMRMADVDVVVWRNDPCGVEGYHLIVPTDQATKLWTGLLAKWGEPKELGKRLLRPAGWAAFNAARIEAGTALFGVDFDGSILPAESGQIDRAVSFTKGCYPGQEIVARMHVRQQVARKLVGIRMEDEALPIAGTRIQDEQGNEIGGVTSSTISPILSNAAICLGFLKKPFFAAESVVRIPAEGAMRRGVVVELPFLKS